MPAIPDRNLPPNELLQLHFQRVHPVAGRGERGRASVSDRDGTTVSSHSESRRADVRGGSAADARETQMSLAEHVEELRGVLLPVPIWWLVCALVAAATTGGGWLHHLATAPVFALPFVYPLLCVQVWRFARPGLVGKETGLLLMVMGLVPAVVAGLAWVAAKMDLPWVQVLGVGLETGYAVAAAKVVVVSVVIGLAVSVGVTVKRLQRFDLLRPAIWLAAGGVLVTVAPAALSGVILCLILLATAGTAIGGLILTERTK